MTSATRHWLRRLPAALQPRGVRYHAASSSQTAHIKGNRVFVFPTRYGFLFILLMLAMLIGATNYSNSMIFALTFLLGSAFIISILHTYRNLAGIKIRMGQIDDCFSGGQATFNIHLSNPSTRPRLDIQLSCREQYSTHIDLDGQSQNSATLLIPGLRRGRLSLGRITLFTTFPFGLIRTWSYVDMEGDALVYPRPGDITLSGQHSSAAGEGEATSESGSDDFHGFRNYQAGDSPRHINWKALAREQALVTKQFNRHQSPELWFDWRDTQTNNIEQALSRLCRWVIDADKRQQRYGLRLPNLEINLADGPQQRQRCLQALALYGK